MRIDQYRYRKIRQHIVNCFVKRDSQICEPPDGVYFAWEQIKDIRWIGLYKNGEPVGYKSRVLIVAHNHTKTKQVWIAPIDATNPEVLNNNYFIIIRERLEKLALQYK